MTRHGPAQSGSPASRGASGGSEGPATAMMGAASGRDGALLVVDVAGHVRHPGVYRLPAGSRVLDALRAAGGARSDADLAAINRAAPVVDGQQVIVAARAGDGGPGVTGAGGGGAGSAGSAQPAHVSLNAADVDGLDALPGIGPVTAKRIVDERTANGPFRSVDDLDRVSGIGPATIESLRDVVTP